MENDSKNINCKKLTCEIHAGQESVLLGIVTGSDDKFLMFKTAKKDYVISKSKINSIIDTNEPFRGVMGK